MSTVKIILFIAFLNSCSTQREIINSSNAYTLDCSGFKVEYNVDSLLKYLNKWPTVNHNNFDSLNKNYHFNTYIITHETIKQK